MSEFYSTRQIASILHIKPDLLTKWIWLNKIQAPVKSPAGDFLWTDSDINRASWVLHHRAYNPEEATV